MPRSRHALMRISTPWLHRTGLSKHIRTHTPTHTPSPWARVRAPGLPFTWRHNVWCPLIMHLPRKCDIKKITTTTQLGPHQMCFGFLFFRKVFHCCSTCTQAIPCNSVSPPGLEPFFHQPSGHSFTTRTRAALSPTLGPFFHHQDSSRSYTTRTAVLSPPGFEPFFHHQDSSRSFTNSRAILSPPGLEPVFHHQDSSRSFTTKTRAVLPPQGLVPVFHHQAKFFLVSESTKKQSPTERINFLRSNTKPKRSPQAERIFFARKTKQSLQNDNHVMTALACKQSRQHLHWPPNKENPR